MLTSRQQNLLLQEKWKVQSERACEINREEKRENQI